jgi:hypothetical protein
MLKISRKAITKFAKVCSSYAGASAIFKLFQARPALLENRIKRPPAGATGSRLQDFLRHAMAVTTTRVVVLSSDGDTDLRSLCEQLRRDCYLESQNLLLGFCTQLVCRWIRKKPPMKEQLNVQ